MTGFSKLGRRAFDLRLSSAYPPNTQRQTSFPGQLAVSLSQSLSCVRTVTAQGDKARYRDNGFGPGGLDEELLPTKTTRLGGMSCCRYSGSCSSSWGCVFLS